MRLPRSITDYRKAAANARRIASQSDDPVFREAWLKVADARDKAIKNGTAVNRQLLTIQKAEVES